MPINPEIVARNSLLTIVLWQAHDNSSASEVEDQHALEVWPAPILRSHPP